MMNTKTNHLSILLSVCFLALPASAQSIPAFPGAEGPGANASGGRGGDVYHVTNLQDDHDGTIPGSLRYGLATAPAAGRTIVFDVGGTINLVADVHQSTHTWLRSGKSNITVAGQTAPGTGITIVGQGAKLSGNNWIFRHVKIRPGQDQSRPGVLTNDGISNNLQNSIIDHISVSWADDEGLSTTDAAVNTTVQYSILGEGLNYNDHSYGSLISSEVDDALLSYHHNLYLHNRSRNPRLGSENGTGAVLNFSNNVIYNWSGRAGYSFEKPSRTNYLSNYYIAGRNTRAGDPVFYSPDTQTQIYHQNGNRVDMNRNGTIDGSLFAFAGPQFSGTADILTQTPFNVASGHVQSADDAVNQVLDYVGAQWWDRDPIDQRLADDVRNGTGAMLNNITDAPQDPNYSYDAEGHPIYGISQRPADFDGDGDGMADEWETAHGLNPTIADNAGDFDSDGYNNLEEYLNDLAAFPAPTTIGWLGGTGRYAEIVNWGISQTVPVGTFTKWQPSRLDSAEIVSGQVTVDSVGQHAGTLTIAPDAGDVAELVVSDGWLQVADQLVIGGDANSSAALQLTGGLLAVPVLSKQEGSVFSFTGGTFAAETVQFDLVNDGGTIAPGSSPGITEVAGNLTINAGTLAIELAAETHDQLIVTGDAQLGGTLALSLLDGLTLDAGFAAEIVDVAGALSEQFDGLGEGSLVGNFGENLYITYAGGDGNDVVLFTMDTLPGDFNDDGRVDLSDYSVWRNNLGGDEVVLSGNGDGLPGVDVGDYAVWKANFGQTAASMFASQATMAVPEPATWILLVLLGALLVGRSRCCSINLRSLAVALVAFGVFCSPVGAEQSASPALADADVAMAQLDGDTAWQAVPDILKRIVPPTFPERDFPITNFGAQPGGQQKCTPAFRDAVAACAAAGGGRVVVPAGKFLTGPIHLHSNVELYLSEGSEVIFSDQFDDYLPVVLVRVGGVELYNYSPLIYARNCTNIAVTGPGKLDGNAEKWWDWKSRETNRGFEMGAAGVPVDERVFGTPKDAIRPSFLSFVDCTNVLLEDFTIGSGPNWTIHPIYCRNTTIRGVHVETDGPNNDGIDPDSCRDMLIENCTFDTGDDCVVLKSGYNQDGWRVGRPTENVIMRNCTSKRGHGGLVIGSEMSGSVRNVYMEDCEFEGTDRAIRIKSRADRGGVVEHIYARNLRVKDMQREVVILNMDYGADRSKLQNSQPPVFRNMLFENITGSGAPCAILVRGMDTSPIRGLVFRNVDVSSDRGVQVSHAQDLVFHRVSVRPAKGPVFELDHASNITIKNSPASADTKVFLQLRGAKTSDILVENCDLQSAENPIVSSDKVNKDACRRR